MPEPRGARELQRLKWATVLLPVAFIWCFELLRFFVVEPAYQNDTTHVVSAIVMGIGVVVFALLVSFYLDRTQQQLVAQNRDLTMTYAVSSATRGGLPLAELIRHALDGMISQTGALAGTLVVIDGPDGPAAVRFPNPMPPGLGWLEPLLDEDPGHIAEAPRYERRSGVDTGVLDIPLMRGQARVGHLRLVFHPPVRGNVSDAALLDVAGDIATEVELACAAEDLRRRERERAALYQVALQLTGRARLPEVLDTISGHARVLLSADRAVMCLDDGRGPGSGAGDGPGAAQADGLTGSLVAIVAPVGGTVIGPATALVQATDRFAITGAQGIIQRVAVADDGTVCLLGHPGRGLDHDRNPICPLIRTAEGTAWAARPLRGPEGSAGELCVVRRGQPFNAAELGLLAALADMAGVAVRTHRLHEAEEQWTILSERDRIARELHDSLAQVLGTIHLRLRALEAQAADAASGSVTRELADLADTADEAYRDVREAILGLRETISAKQGLEGALREYLAKYSRQTGIMATLACTGDTRSALPPRSEVQLLRVVQEALTNVRKHSGARRATVRIDCTTAIPSIAIEDNGVGFDPASLVTSFDGGFGMTSMRERVEQIGGTLDVHTAPGEGTRIVVRLEAEDARGTSTPAPARAAGR
jgi:signal transduction histidine kinase